MLCVRNGCALYRVPQALAALVLWLAPAHADTIGQVTEVAKNAFADNAGTKRDLTSGADVSALEIISTDKIGKASLRFADDTRLSVGPGSALVLDRFVYDPEKSSSSFVIKATKGVFRFATGRGDHAAYRIETPNASIGVRGTEFDVVLDEKTVRVSVRSGLVNVCPNGAAAGGGCANARKGQSVVAEPTRARTVPTKSLPPIRLALLPLPKPVLPKAAALPVRPAAASAAASAKAASAGAQKATDKTAVGRKAAAAARRAEAATGRQAKADGQSKVGKKTKASTAESANASSAKAAKKKANAAPATSRTKSAKARTTEPKAEKDATVKSTTAKAAVTKTLLPTAAKAAQKKVEPPKPR